MSSSSYTPSSDDWNETQSQPKKRFGCSTPSRFQQRAERRQTYLNSIAGRTLQQYYKPGGALDSQTTKTQWENGLWNENTPPRKALVHLQQQDRRSMTLSDSDDKQMAAALRSMSEVNNDFFGKGDLTLVGDITTGVDAGGKDKINVSKAEDITLSAAVDDDIPIASSPPPVLVLSAIQTFEEYNGSKEMIGSFGGAQLPLGWSDTPEIPVAHSPSPVDAVQWNDLTDIEKQIVTAVRSIVEDETAAIRERADNVLEGHWQEVSDLYDSARQQNQYINMLRELLQTCNVDIPEM
ncbi:hypothetical protein EV421DRAFT_1908668 [Armillaria borealis]|uniref:Uncharacterized protein n=1 Tax=Armillaria borealis TaxID=47425 RepID=A0AA39J4C7_9AGAR|nr:hypothetical protein EV421DRAFT_1908668 [Armillaria borealis]